jgi:hypothetical protein
MDITEARNIGATNFRVQEPFGWPPKPQVVADWPQHLFPPEGPDCRCASCERRFQE